MKRMPKIRVFYLIVFVVVVFIFGTGTTYAYWAATANSTKESVKTESTIYSINMNVLPLYNDFSFIPMNDVDAVKALKNGCKDKYGRGACAAYTMKVFGYSNTLSHVSGFMDITTNNMQNLSYMMFRVSDTYDEEKCVNIEVFNENYCIVKEAAVVGDGVGLSLGDAYKVAGTTDTKFILLLWLSNFQYSQNDIDVGSFDAIVTMQAGNGGKVMGSISSVLEIENMKDGVNE